MGNSVKYVLGDLTNLENSSNELFVRLTLNRNFKKLLENDLNLNELYRLVVEDHIKIHEFVEGGEYQKGDLVWFVDKNIDGEQTLYLLESIKDHNTNTPKLQLNEEKIYTFLKSFWNDKNELRTIIENSLVTFVNSKLGQLMEGYHEYDVDYHKYGMLSDKREENDKKILLKDFSNIDETRYKNFFPYRTFPLSTDTVIQSGTGRIWDNGLLEYDVVFKVGCVGYERYEGGIYTSISCNCLDIESNGIDPNGYDYSENYKYFTGGNVFNILYPNDLSIKLGGMILHNRGNYVNSYSGKIVFPIPFKDLNYMVFTSDVRCQDRNISKATIDPGMNSLTFTNKTIKYITALYVTYPEENRTEATSNGLIVNSFHCLVIGRWK